jgi:hypothetical protein
VRVTHNRVTIRCRTNETVSGCRAVARNGSKTSLPEPWPYGQPPRCSKSLPDTFAFVRWRVWRGFRWRLLTATGDQRGFRSRARVCCACTKRAPAFVRVISPKAFRQRRAHAATNGALARQHGSLWSLSACSNEAKRAALLEHQASGGDEDRSDDFHIAMRKEQSVATTPCRGLSPSRWAKQARFDV